MKKTLVVLICLLFVCATPILQAQEDADEKYFLPRYEIEMIIPANYLVFDQYLTSNEIFSLKLQGIRNELLLFRMESNPDLQGIDIEKEILWQLNVNRNAATDYKRLTDSDRDSIANRIKTKQLPNDQYSIAVDWYYHKDAYFIKEYSGYLDGSSFTITYSTYSKDRSIIFTLVIPERMFTAEEIKDFEDMLDKCSFVLATGSEPYTPPNNQIPINKRVNYAPIILLFFGVFLLVYSISKMSKLKPPVNETKVNNKFKEVPPQETATTEKTRTVICPGCGASCMIKPGQDNRCEYCNRHLG